MMHRSEKRLAGGSRVLHWETPGQLESRWRAVL